jgi:hypothetical protein
MYSNFIIIDPKLKLENHPNISNFLCNIELSFLSKSQPYICKKQSFSLFIWNVQFNTSTILHCTQLFSIFALICSMWGWLGPQTSLNWICRSPKIFKYSIVMFFVLFPLFGSSLLLSLLLWSHFRLQWIHVELPSKCATMTEIVKTCNCLY